MENYRSNAFPFGLGWRKSPHESPHTHTSLFPIPIAVGGDGHDAPSGYHPSPKGVTSIDGIARLLLSPQSIVPIRQVIGHFRSETFTHAFPGV
jgi:hypothetical protein